jgi:hypothetical protein
MVLHTKYTGRRESDRWVVDIMTRASHYESFTMSGVGYNDLRVRVTPATLAQARRHRSFFRFITRTAHSEAERVRGTDERLISLGLSPVPLTVKQSV